jgi:4-hydroxybenzoate polyprenyltransferase
MVVLFVLANAGAATTKSSSGLVAALAATLGFFFRLRLFDEIKDYEVDRVVNPGRPLARGLLKVGEVKRVIYVLTVFELLVCAWLSPVVLATHALAVGYSFLMYQEFFIGHWLRRHLTTYAVTHTVVTVPLGWSVAAQASGRAVWTFPPVLLGFALVNWTLFNVFEFGRKTFAPAEERPHVDSYSSIFRPAGAGVLMMSQVLLALLILRLSVAAWLPQLALAAAPLLATVVYVWKRSTPAARIFRGMSAAYILLFYALLAWQMWGR